MNTQAPHLPLPLAGIGLKDEHLGLMGFPGFPGMKGVSGGTSTEGHDTAAIGFVECHAENLMGAGGPRLQAVARLRESRPLSLHGVGLSIGGPGPLDAAHLARLSALVQRLQPRWFSEHLAWSSHGGVHLNDLLPLPYDSATLARVCRHVHQLQERLQRRVLLENPSTYLAFEASSMGEAEFLAAVVRRTGCGLLLDVNNLWVSAVNHGRDAHADLAALLAAVPAGTVGEIHLAGHEADRDATGAPLLIDTHGQPVAAPVWALYRRAIAQLGPVPTLIERDQNLPPWPDQVAEVAHALAVQVEAANASAVRGDLRAAPKAVGVHARAEAIVGTIDTIDTTDTADTFADFAAALLNPTLPPPPGLRVHDGTDPTPRLNVHRNNVVASLASALADTVPVLRQVLGEADFAALARGFLAAHPPRSPVLAEWGEALPAWLAAVPAAQARPWLAELAALERARVQAFHAADAAAALTLHATLAAAWACSDTLPQARLQLHPSVQALQAMHAVLSLWRAAQSGSVDADGIDLPEPSEAPEAALVLRDASAHDAVVVVPVPPPTAQFVAALSQGQALGPAVAAAPGLDLPEALALLLRLGALVGWRQAGVDGLDGLAADASPTPSPICTGACALETQS